MECDLNKLYCIWQEKHTELLEAKSHDAIRLRMHRAFSWLRVAEDFKLPEHVDSRLIFSWTTLNTLYAKWDSNLSNRDPEWQVREDFIRRIVEQDSACRIQQTLLANRKHCDRLLSEEHLVHSYWGNPSEVAARKARVKPKKIAKHYHVPEEVIRVVIPLMKCIAMLRSQLIHGMSTYGSSANREVVEAAATFMFDFVHAILQCIVHDNLWEDDESWQPVPYPPMQPHFRRDS